MINREVKMIYTCDLCGKKTSDIKRISIIKIEIDDGEGGGEICKPCVKKRLKPIIDKINFTLHAAKEVDDEYEEDANGY